MLQRAAMRYESVRTVILTEDEPLFAADGLNSLLSETGNDIDPVLCVLAGFSPAGPRLGTRSLLSYLWITFGAWAFVRVGLHYLRCRINPSKRPASVLRKHRVPVRKINRDINSRKVLDAIRAARPDLIVSTNMNSLFGAELLKIAPCLNLHLSLLPRHRGLMPVFWALHDGDSETGATVFKVDSSVDGGEILVQKRHTIRERRLIPLYSELKALGINALAEAIRSWRWANGVVAPASGTYGPAGNRRPCAKSMRRFWERGNRII